MEDKNLDKYVGEIINLRDRGCKFPTTLNDILKDLNIHDKTNVIKLALTRCKNQFTLTDEFTIKLKDFLNDELIKK